MDGQAISKSIQKITPKALAHPCAGLIRFGICNFQGTSTVRRAEEVLSRQEGELQVLRFSDAVMQLPRPGSTDNALGSPTEIRELSARSLQACLNP